MNTPRASSTFNATVKVAGVLLSVFCSKCSCSMVMKSIRPSRSGLHPHDQRGPTNPLQRSSIHAFYGNVSFCKLCHCQFQPETDHQQGQNSQKRITRLTTWHGFSGAAHWASLPPFSMSFSPSKWSNFRALTTASHSRMEPAYPVGHFLRRRAVHNGYHLVLSSSWQFWAPFHW